MSVDMATPRPQDPASTKLQTLLEQLLKNETIPHSFTISYEGTSKFMAGADGANAPTFEVIICNAAGYDACMSLHELPIAEAYMRGDIDIKGDLIKVVINFQNLLNDRNVFIKTWRIVKPLILGRERCNPQWIAKHYDSDNLQLLGIENDYDTYTPGIYEHDDEAMESAAERKLAFAFDALQLQAGDTVLDVGSGWGGFLRYAAAKGAQVTGVTLSKDQHAYVTKLIRERNFDQAEVLYQDFFTYEPNKKFDAISMMGVIEDLSDYKRVFKTLPHLLKPGGRVYLDFASEKESFATRSFITKYIWPGTFRMVYMPQFIDAVRGSMFEIEGIYDDRHNYHLWAKKAYEKLLVNKQAFVEQSDERLWRMFLLLYAGTSAAMIKSDYFCTAYRVVLRLPDDHQDLTSLV